MHAGGGAGGVGLLVFFSCFFSSLQISEIHDFKYMNATLMAWRV